MNSIAACMLLMVAAATASITDHLNGVSGKEKEELQRTEDQCRKYYNLDASRVNRFIDGGDDSCPNFICFFRCVTEKHGSMDLKGNLNYTRLQHLFDADQYKVIKKCSARHENEQDTCFKPYIIYKCFRDEWLLEHD